MQHSKTFKLEPENNARLIDLCGEHNDNLQQIEKYFNVEINHRGHEFHVLGDAKEIAQAHIALENLFALTNKNKHISKQELNLIMHTAKHDKPLYNKKFANNLQTAKLLIKPRTLNQQHYVSNILQYDINFGIGPAGTGKTYLAVAYAVQALEREDVVRIIITRPAVEAGERLGYLPGDIAQKVDPYLRPIYDALYEFLGFTKVSKLLENGIIEIAPLAFMRGRTLNDAAIILDEAQNTSTEQMKMFLTRIGFGSKAIINGDITQIDLPKHIKSGLKHAVDILRSIAGVGFTHFDKQDIVRHPLVQKIVAAYEEQLGDLG